MQEAIKKADVLIEALPYIRSFHNKVVVIKYGGSILGEEKIRKGVLEDIVFMNFMGLKTVLVHGGGPNISDRMRQSGKKTDFVDGMRVTDEQTLNVVEEELQKLNAMIVNEITELGCHAIGLNGKENKLLA
ncbi:MAG TPA: acetylglutamate kinase, partial [Candidatus Omnitrophota bacterium]|nr:acetylglutamate kinase [Candidatus Omnitrophota bacterium]